MGLAWLLIEHGADAAVQSKDGSTPLHRASFEGYVDVARLLIGLIENSADAAIQTKDGTNTGRIRCFGVLTGPGS